MPGQKPEADANEARDLDENRLKDIFRQIDVDGSGSIDVDELMDAMLLFGVKATKNSAKKVLAAIDTDGNGTVELDEFLTFFSKLKDPDEIKNLLAATNGKYLDYKQLVENDSNFGKTFYIPPGQSPVAAFEGHSDEITSVRFISLTKFVTASLDQTLKIWDRTGEGMKKGERRPSKDGSGTIVRYKGSFETVDVEKGSVYCM